MLKRSPAEPSSRGQSRPTLKRREIKLLPPLSRRLQAVHLTQRGSSKADVTRRYSCDQSGQRGLQALRAKNKTDSTKAGPVFTKQEILDLLRATVIVEQDQTLQITSTTGQRRIWHNKCASERTRMDPLSTIPGVSHYHKEIVAIF